MSKHRPRSKSFTAILERSGDRLNWTMIRVPLSVAQVWGVRGQLKVKGEINGFPFRTSLFPNGKGEHLMIVNKKMQAGARVAVGEKAEFRLEPDTANREVIIPEELLNVLSRSKRLKKFFESFSYSMRLYMARWIAEGKHQETRLRRAEQLAERLMLTMEAERELPPVLSVALARNPVAREGWDRMPPGHRRSHLMGIFGYRSPESQARRVAKAVQEMMEYAKRTRSRAEDQLDS